MGVVVVKFSLVQQTFIKHSYLQVLYCEQLQCSQCSQSLLQRNSVWWKRRHEHRPSSFLNNSGKLYSPSSYSNPSSLLLPSQTSPMRLPSHSPKGSDKEEELNEYLLTEWMDKQNIKMLLSSEEGKHMPVNKLAFI